MLGQESRQEPKQCRRLVKAKIESLIALDQSGRDSLQLWETFCAAIGADAKLNSFKSYLEFSQSSEDKWWKREEENEDEQAWYERVERNIRENLEAKWRRGAGAISDDWVLIFVCLRAPSLGATDFFSNRFKEGVNLLSDHLDTSTPDIVLSGGPIAGKSPAVSRRRNGDEDSRGFQPTPRTPARTARHPRQASAMSAPAKGGGSTDSGGSDDRRSAPLTNRTATLPREPLSARSSTRRVMGRPQEARSTVLERNRRYYARYKTQALSKIECGGVHDPVSPLGKAVTPIKIKIQEVLDKRSGSGISRSGISQAEHKVLTEASIGVFELILRNRNRLIVETLSQAYQGARNKSRLFRRRSAEERFPRHELIEALGKGRTVHWEENDWRLGDNPIQDAIYLGIILQDCAKENFRSTNEKYPTETLKFIDKEVGQYVGDDLGSLHLLKVGDAELAKDKVPEAIDQAVGQAARAIDELSAARSQAQNMGRGEQEEMDAEPEDDDRSEASSQLDESEQGESEDDDRSKASSQLDESEQGESEDDDRSESSSQLDESEQGGFDNESIWQGRDDIEDLGARDSLQRILCKAMTKYAEPYTSPDAMRKVRQRKSYKNVQNWTRVGPEHLGVGSIVALILGQCGNSWRQGEKEKPSMQICLLETLCGKEGCSREKVSLSDETWNRNNAKEYLRRLVRVQAGLCADQPVKQQGDRHRDDVYNFSDALLDRVFALLDGGWNAKRLRSFTTLKGRIEDNTEHARRILKASELINSFVELVRSHSQEGDIQFESLYNDLGEAFESINEETSEKSWLFRDRCANDRATTPESETSPAQRLVSWATYTRKQDARSCFGPWDSGTATGSNLAHVFRQYHKDQRSRNSDLDADQLTPPANE